MTLLPARHLVLATLLLSLLPGCAPRVEPPRLRPELRAELERWLAAHRRTPADYVVGLFAGHDVVLLGEQHKIGHDAVFVRSLVAPLHRAGVSTLALEFARREDQPLVDSLIAAPEWREDLARLVQFRQLVSWGFQEYVDLYRGAWELNRSLPPGAPRFRVLGLNDSPDWSQVRTPADRDNAAVMARVWRGGSEEQWARVILEAVGRGEKVLAYSGIHHAFSGYRQPVVIEGRFRRFDETRMGNYLRRALGGRVATVYLHAPWNGPRGYGDDWVHPADGVIDALMLRIPGGPRPVGFDLAGTPFGRLAPRNCVYRHGYPDFRLSDFCDGWIYTKPISRYEGVTPVEGWVNERNLYLAQRGSPSPRWRDRGADEFNAMIARDADVARKWRHLR